MVVLLFFRAPFVPLRAIFFIMCGLTSCVVQYLQLDNNIDMTEAFLRADETVMKWKAAFGLHIGNALIGNIAAPLKQGLVTAIS
jgi:hypothetical protein